MELTVAVGIGGLLALYLIVKQPQCWGNPGEKLGSIPYTRGMKNLFGDIPEALPQELFEHIVGTTGVRIERIVSAGHATPAGEWYDQEWNEWVMVLQGRALLRVEGEREARSLGPGDHAFLPAHCRRRVDWTDPQAVTLWLAVHWPPELAIASIGDGAR